MFPIREGDNLVRITRYELIRDGEKFDIEALFHLAGAGDHLCEALLYHQGDLADENISGEGDNELAAVRHLLLQIEGLSAEQLFALFG